MFSRQYTSTGIVVLGAVRHQVRIVSLNLLGGTKLEFLKLCHQDNFLKLINYMLCSLTLI